VRNQRRALSLDSFTALPDRQESAALHCALLLRLAVLLHRSHSREDVPFRSLEASDGTLDLELPEDWLEAHPLTAADLATEVDYLRDKQRKLEIYVS
jgi:exopolyphosphatase/guanosine-5'-triphosphate,3'-diphosphate pyrophosphatase